MMTYHTFLANIFGLCEFILSDRPSRVWVNGETGVTSVISPEEFFEQALGDNDWSQISKINTHFGDQWKT